MSERHEKTPIEAAAAEVKLRRSLLGYKRADVDDALRAREEELGGLEDEIDTREAELEQLRQDIAALWLAFAQHDRTLEDIRAAVLALADERAGAKAATPTPTPAPATATEPEPVPVDEEDEAVPPAPVESVPEPAPQPSVGRQLADLDDVLAAIEMATQTLEQTYADEIEESEAARSAAASEEADEPEEDDAEEEPR